MNKILVLVTMMFFALIVTAQNKKAIPATASAPTVAVYTNEANLLSTVSIRWDKNNNRIYFSSPFKIEGISISIKDRANHIILKQNNMTINKTYSISFPDFKSDKSYTIILQKENHILVERLPKVVL